VSDEERLDRIRDYGATDEDGDWLLDRLDDATFERDVLASRLAAATAERDAARKSLRSVRGDVQGLNPNGFGFGEQVDEIIADIDAALAAPAGEVQP
jgi:hypothetical protein